MLIDADMLVLILTVAGGSAVGAAIGGLSGGLVKWTGGKLHLFVVGCMAAGAGLGFTYGEPLSVPGYVGAAEARAVDMGLPSGGSESAVLRVLKAYYPGDYAGAVLALKAGAAGKTTRSETRSAFDGAVAPVLAHELPKASTENTLAFLKLARREQKAMMGDPAACWRAMHAIGPAPAAADLPQNLRDDEMRLMARLLTQTALAPQNVPLPADTSARLRRVASGAMADLPAASRQALAGIEGRPNRVQAQAACDFGLRLYEALLAAPDDDAAQMFKALAASSPRRLAI